MPPIAPGTHVESDTDSDGYDLIPDFPNKSSETAEWCQAMPQTVPKQKPFPPPTTHLPTPPSSGSPRDTFSKCALHHFKLYFRNVQNFHFEVFASSAAVFVLFSMQLFHITSGEGLWDGHMHLGKLHLQYLYLCHTKPPTTVNRM